MLDFQLLECRWPWTHYKIVYGDGSEDYTRGDVNEDGEVNIKDLQIILRGVCEKIELTETAEADSRVW